MKTQSTMALGRLASPVAHPLPRLRLGGRRPPRDPGRPGRRIPQYRTRRHMRSWLRGFGFVGLSVILAAPATAAESQSFVIPNLTGKYRCEGDVTGCGRTGSTLTISQSGPDLKIQSDNGNVSSATLTSEISINTAPDWNMFGTISSADDRVIAWSNGTIWRRV